MLETTFSSETSVKIVRIKNLIVVSLSLYNAILRWPSLNVLGIILSTIHFEYKVYTIWRVCWGWFKETRRSLLSRVPCNNCKNKLLHSISFEETISHKDDDVLGS